jgi:LytS/YehU family sensor histidine kinase
VLWVVALGPAAFVAALVKVLGPDVGWLVLLQHYGVAVLHFLGYTVLCSLGLILYRRRGGSRLVALPIAAGALALFAGVGLVFRSSATHFLHDAIVAIVVLAVEQLYHRLVAARMEAEHRELERERQRRAALEARWNSLESRVRPHFLFNTLSSLRELVRRNAEEAEAMIQRLAELLRFSLDSEHRSTVPLEEEMRMVAGYLEIERMRLGARLQWEAAMAPECRALPVPTLSVLTLAENSVKHAVAPRPAGGRVRIAAGLREGALRVEVADDGPGFDASAIARGHGLDLLLGRLEDGAHDGGRLEIRRGSPGAVVTLSLPVRGAERMATA